MIRAWLNSIVAKSAAFVLLLMCCALNIRAGDKASELEYKVKAVLLLKLISCVEWPSNSFTSADAPFRIAIVGTDPFGDVLEKVLEGETPKRRTPEILRVKSASECASSQLVFISSSEKERFDRELETLGSRPFLTVSDIDRFARRGGMVGMVRDEKNVRFEVNLDTCQRANLNISARLSTLARVVKSEK